jgi:hypothetical protein
MRVDQEVKKMDQAITAIQEKEGKYLTFSLDVEKAA